MMEWRRALDLLVSALRLMVGQSDYNAYRAHMAARHPDDPIMDRRAFFRHREAARYGGKHGGRCC